MPSMQLSTFLTSFLLAGAATAQSSSSSIPIPGNATSSNTTVPQPSSLVPLGVIAGSVTITGPNNPITGSVRQGDIVPTGSLVSYLSYSSTITLSASGQSGPYNSSLTGTTANSTARSTPTSSRTGGTVVGALPTSASAYTTVVNGTTVTLNATRSSSTSTSSAPRPTNTRPCNGYPELCNRSYANITNICAHNSPFTNQNNVARNQDYGVTAQLNDGVRMLQGQTHYIPENNTLYFCHTSCSLLNAGTVEAYLTEVANWVRRHPYDVVTILLGNANFVWVTNYTTPIQNSGLGPYLYYPPQIPMALDDWPTLSQMITTGKRVVIFMDYMANQGQVPYILDQYSQMWETPFSPTDVSFPCTVNRPPDLQADNARNRMYIANHNLNVPITLLGNTILVPNTVYINQTNGVSGLGSLGKMADDCAADWNRPPNFLVVDFYNMPPNGSVFEVAAMHNGVNYTDTCCGYNTSAGAALTAKGPVGYALAMAVAVVSLIFAL